ncbi:PREDICTED: uncharacterized protein LOC109116484 [Tarenaya hassleriana]|uniref:uncharacterized protein LOC109116484 n=1 Tax=Tarenaya hassleriana TaxID=28532 RepID=UPI0008FD902F|nr:PREDICTED: uncharacterized protein LOC109116484 [Tarenaya hassleriana]
MAPRRARSITGDNSVPNHDPRADGLKEFQEEMRNELRNELRVFQEAMIQTLRAHIPAQPPVRDQGPMAEDLPPPPPAPATAGDYLPIIRELRSMHTPRFEGSLDPEVAEEWLTQITQDLEYVQCPLRYRATIASHHLSGPARHWWRKVTEEMPAGHHFSWEEFKEEFERKYYRRHDQERSLSAFLNLQQGDMTIRAYEAEFIPMLNYASHLVPHEYMKIQKFIAGLRPSLRRKVVLHEFRTLGHCIDQLEKAEEAEKEEKEERIRDRSPPRRYTHTRPPVKVAQSSQGNEAQQKVKAPSVRAPPPPVRGPLTCFRCQQPGHFAANCTANIEALPATRPPRPPPRAGAAPRVYALASEMEIQEEETDSEAEEAVAIAGTLHLCDVECYTLFDTGATHSFLSLENAKKLDMERTDLGSDFTVRTPSGEILPIMGHYEEYR